MWHSAIEAAKVMNQPRHVRVLGLAMEMKFGDVSCGCGSGACVSRARECEVESSGLLREG